MKRLLVVLAATLLVVGCSQAAPAPAPTTAPAPPKAAPTTAPAAAPAPTKAPEPAKKIDWPQKGKAITWIVAYAAGGASDIQARILAPLMEKELGVPVEVVNRPGGGAQIGYTELAKAKPDGYTIGWVLFPGVQTVYLDPDRKAVFTRKDVPPVGMAAVDPHAVAVAANSKYKTLKELVDDAKANPGKVTITTAALMGDGHLGLLMFQQAIGAKFRIVNFDGAPQAIVEVLGGRADACVQTIPNFTAQVKSGEIKFLGIMDSKQSSYAPGVPTLQSQGINVVAGSEKVLAVPGGTPKEIVDILANALKKALENPEAKTKFDEFRSEIRWMDAAQVDKRWTELEGQVKPLIEIAKQK